MTWHALTGVVEWWANEGLRERGRRGAGTGPFDANIDVARAAFVARRTPWRLSEVSLVDDADPIAPAVASWADEATAVLEGRPAAQTVVGPRESWGDLGLRRMLEPASLEQILPPPWPAAFTVPGDAVERDVSLLPELLSRGSERYEVEFDLDLGVVTSWSAVIQGQVAQRARLTHLTHIAL